MRIIAASYGSAGDFVPTVAVAAALVRRGHGVTLFANPVYATAISGTGVTFVPAGEPADLVAAVRADPTLLEPLRGGRRLIHDWLLPDIRAGYVAVRNYLATNHADLFIGAFTSYGAYWAAAEKKTPHVVVAATPLSWLNPCAPMPLTPWPLPGIVNAALMLVLRTVTRVAMGRVLEKGAGQLGVGGVDCSYRGPERAPLLHAGMWSPLVRPAATGDPAGSVVCGSARASSFSGGDAALPSELASFIAAGKPPVVVALGSIFSQGNPRLLNTIADAVHNLGERCIIVGHLPQRPVGDWVRVVGAAPYDQLFPHARAMMIHGGAGSTAEALRSGRPAAVLPFGFDQYAMGRVVERLGCGRMFNRRCWTPTGLTAALRGLLDDTECGATAHSIGKRVSAEQDGAERTADLIEERMCQ